MNEGRKEEIKIERKDGKKEGCGREGREDQSSDNVE